MNQAVRSPVTARARAQARSKKLIFLAGFAEGALRRKSRRGGGVVARDLTMILAPDVRFWPTCDVFDHPLRNPVVKLPEK